MANDSIFVIFDVGEATARFGQCQVAAAFDEGAVRILDVEIDVELVRRAPLDRAERRIALVGLADLAEDIAVGDQIIGLLAIFLTLEFRAIVVRDGDVGAARGPGRARRIGLLGIVGVVALEAERDADRVVRELVDIAQRPAPADAAADPTTRSP